MAGLVLLLGLFATLFDVTRDPGRQLSAGAYLWAVRGYQEWGRPLLAGRVQCRFVPSCSVYSSEAVRRFGILPGLVRTARRIARCAPSVPLETPDPLPRPGESTQDGNHFESTVLRSSATCPARHDNYEG